MNLKKIKVENFRLLKDFELDLKDDLSLIIGKNNCGKTSILILLDKILNSSRVAWEDINIGKQKELYEQIKNKVKSTENEAINFLESVKLQLFIQYDDQDSYANIQKFMMDLEPDNNIIILEFVSLIDENRILKLQNIISEKKLDNFVSFSKFMKKNFLEFFILQKYSRGYDPKSKQVTKERSEYIENKDIQKVIKITGIQADREVSNSDRNHVLSNLTEEYYNICKLDVNNKLEVFEKLQNAVDEADKAFYKIYNGEEQEKEEGVFSRIIKVIKQYGGIDDELQITIESSISEKNLLSKNTSLCYKQGENASLPETYNGLGYLNLIGILFEIETKIKELYSEPADINIMYIEEPEAHTHPQLQYIFIRNIKEHIKEHKDSLLKNKNKNIQIVLTSHSSHIVSECNFDDIIYLKKVNDNIIAKNFNSLENEYQEDRKKGFKFVKQYLTLNRSELFFADKVICIEGDTERILMPAMMNKVDLKFKENNSKSKMEFPLLSQNISIIEVGAHSHIFMPLFEFLGIKVLIITDIDAVEQKEITDKNGKKRIIYLSCHPKKATHTSNASIKYFFEKEGLFNIDDQFKVLVQKEFKDKEKNNMRIAYQIPDDDVAYQASSFEDAFIALNKNFIISNKEEFKEYGALKSFEDIENFYEFASEKIEKKPAFASSILYFDGENNEEWRVPKYIEEGLLWIKS